MRQYSGACRQYSGSCHCGQLRFTLTAIIGQLRACNCSICKKRGALMVRVADDQLQLLTPLEQLTLYQWGSFTAKDYFCPRCGILAFRRTSALTAAEIAAGKTPFTGWAVNARCLQDVDLRQLPIIAIDGAAL